MVFITGAKYGGGFVTVMVDRINDYDEAREIAYSALLFDITLMCGLCQVLLVVKLYCVQVRLFVRRGL